jgi:MFS family permease
VIIDLSPLKKYPQFRLLFAAQLVSVLGSSISYVAAPFLIYQITQSTAHVGLLGVISLIPMTLFGFWGGSVADVWNRKKIVIVCESLLALCCVVFALLIQTDNINEKGIMVLTAIMAALAGFLRPAIESLTPRMVSKEDMPQVSTLNGFRGTFAHILGPALGGILITTGGSALAFWIDGLSYVISVVCMLGLKNPLRDEAPKHRPGLKAIREGFAYALARPILLGTYVVDIIAMIFCFPMALFPAIAEMSGGPSKLGPLYSAISVGAMVATIFSRWTYKVRRHGAMVFMGAMGWCVCVIAFAILVPINYWAAICFLAFAGFWDMISATFRFTIWNETIPDSHRGRMAGIEMMSYMSGPLLGNTILGYLAAATSSSRALVYGASTSIVLLLFAVVIFWPFWVYVASPRKESR